MEGKRRGPEPKYRLDTTWRAELAYAVGLIATDGCLSGDGRHIDFTSKDRELVETFRSCLGLQVKIGLKSRGTEKEKKYSRVQISSVDFYRWLNSIGLTAQKSHTINKLEIPEV